MLGRKIPTKRSRALRGTRQTAQRAEVSALWRALHTATQRINVVSDNNYTVDTANAILVNKSNEHQGQHREVWNHIINLSQKLHSIRWMKAHTTPERAETRGMKPEDRRGNNRADELATIGTQLHEEGETHMTNFKQQMDLVICTQRYILRSNWLIEKAQKKKCENADGELPCRRHRRGRGRPREPDKLHTHMTTQGGGFEVCLQL